MPRFKQLQLDSDISELQSSNITNEKSGDFVSAPNIVQTSKSIVVGSGSGMISIVPGVGLLIGEKQPNSNLHQISLSADNRGTIARVGAIKIASAEDLQISTTNPAATVNKVIYSDNTNDLRINSPGTTSVVSLDTNAKKRFIVGINKSSLTNGNVNSIFELAMTAGSYSGGTIDWEVVASDGADYQTRAGITTWAAVNVAGAYTSDVDEIGSSIAASGGTLTGAWSVVSGTNKIILKFTPTSSLTPTTLAIYCSVKNNYGATITIL